MSKDRINETSVEKHDTLRMVLIFEKKKKKHKPLPGLTVTGLMHIPHLGVMIHHYQAELLGVSS